MIPTYVSTFALDQQVITARLLSDLGAQGIEGPLWYFDNGSQDLSLIRKQNKDAIELVGHNLADIIDATGVALYEMWNMALDKAQAAAKAVHAKEWNLAILNNDIIVGPRFIQTLAVGLRQDKRLFAVSANYDNRRTEHPLQRVKGTYGNHGLAGFAFMVAGERLAEHDIRFDEQFNWWYGDEDFILQIEKAGGHYALVERAKCVHVFEQTAAKHTDRLAPTIHDDRAKLEKKWDAA